MAFKQSLVRRNNTKFLNIITICQYPVPDISRGLEDKRLATAISASWKEDVKNTRKNIEISTD